MKSAYILCSHIGEAAGNLFSLYQNVDGYITPTETTVTRAQLLAGYTTLINLNLATTTIRIKPNNGYCSDSFADIIIGTVIQPTPTPMPTATPTPTPTPTGTPTGVPINITGVAFNPNGTCTAGAIVYVTSAVAALYSVNGSFADINGYTLYANATLATVIPQTYASDANGVIWNVSAGTLSSATGNVC